MPIRPGCPSRSWPFGLHRETVRAHLRRQGVTLRPQRVLTDSQEIEAVRLYVEETWSLAEVAARLGVGQTAVRNVLVRCGEAGAGAAGTPDLRCQALAAPTWSHMSILDQPGADVGVAAGERSAPAGRLMP